MTGNKIITALIASGFFMAACQLSNSRQQYISYINDPEHKITQKIKVGDVQATIKWLPPDYRKLITLDSGTYEASDGFHYFDIRFDKVIGDKPSKEKILYLDFDMHNDFVMLQGADSVGPIFCQRIENGTPGSYQYMLAFEKRHAGMEEGFSVLYRDKIFGIGAIVFVYNKEDIKKIPNLNPAISK